MALDPKQFWDKITTTPRPYEVVPLMRMVKGVPTEIARLAITVLTQDESEDAFAAAEKATKKKLGLDEGKPADATQGYIESRKLSSSKEILTRCCYFVDDHDQIRIDEPFFPTLGHLGQNFSTSEIGVLMNSYIRIQRTLGPFANEMSTDQMVGLIRQLAAGGRYHPLDSLSWGALIDLVIFLISLVASSWTGTSSRGSPPAPASTDTAASKDGLST